MGISITISSESLFGLRTELTKVVNLLDASLTGVQSTGGLSSIKEDTLKPPSLLGPLTMEIQRVADETPKEFIKPEMKEAVEKLRALKSENGKNAVAKILERATAAPEKQIKKYGPRVEKKPVGETKTFEAENIAPEEPVVSTPQQDFGPVGDVMNLETQTPKITAPIVPETILEKHTRIDVRKAATELLARRKAHNNDGILVLQNILSKVGATNISSLSEDKFGVVISEFQKF